jgi:hypothetical protein
LTAATVTV